MHILPSQFYLRFLFVLTILWGGSLGAWAQEETPEEEETPAEGEEAPVEGEEEEEEEPPYVPLEKLVFVEAHFDDELGVDGLNGAYTVELSPDGNFVYAASMNDDAVSLFSRDAETGELSYISRVKNGENGVSGLNGARSLAISSDGNHLYVVSMFDHSLATFSRNTLTGELTFLGRLKDGEAGVDGLNGARSVSISPDGLNLYVGGWGDNALAIFGRDVSTGAVSFLGRLKNNEDGIDGLDAPHYVKSSPDGKTVYVALWDEDAVSFFTRSEGTGLLEYSGKVVDETDDVNGLKGPRAIACSTDGAYVYVATWNDDAIVVFDRDEEGVLTFNSYLGEGSGGVSGMDGPHSLAISAEGDFVYVASFFDDAVTVFVRDGETGKLTYDQSIRDGDSVNPVVVEETPEEEADPPLEGEDPPAEEEETPAEEEPPVEEEPVDEGEKIVGLNGALTIATSPDGEHVYLATSNDKSLVAFRREIIIEPPVITLQPEAQSVSQGEPAVFNALAEGQDVAYQWQLNGVNIPGANLPVWTLETTFVIQDGREYRVVVSNGGGEVVSEVAILSVTPPVTLEAPDNLTALDVSNTSARLEWSDVNSNETGYEIQRKVASGTFVTIGTVFADVESYDDESLDPGTTYIYHVRAKKNAEISLWSNDAVIESFENAPIGPANLFIESSGYSSVDLRWSDRSAVETGYRIQRQDVSSGGGNFTTVGTVEKSVSIYKDRGVDENGTYAYRVQAYNESGDSPFSNTAVATTSDLPLNSISPLSASVPAGESSGNLVVVSAVTESSEWEAFTEEPWIALQSPPNGIGFGSTSVSYRVLANESQEEREGTIEIGGLLHIVTQAAADPFLEVSPGDSNFANTGGTVSISVNANVAWTAISDSTWIEVLDGITGENDGVIRFRVDENLSTHSREGKITINDVEHPVTQGGQNFYVILSPTAEVFSITGGDGMFEIESNTAWSISTDVAWIEFLDTLTGTGNAFKNYRVLENDTELSRIGRIFVNDIFIDVVQGGGGDKPIAPTETVVAWEGGLGFSYDLTADETPAMSVDEDWVTITGFSISEGTGTLSFDVAAHLGPDERIALIAIGSEQHAVRQSGKPVAAPSLDSFSVASGAEVTIERSVGLAFAVGSEGDAPVEYRASESIAFQDTEWMPLEEELSFKLSYDAGTKRVYFQTRNAGGESAIISDGIEYAPLVVPEFLESRYNPLEGFYGRLECEIGESYRLECSTDMKSWHPLKEFVADAIEEEVADNTGIEENCLFYRVVKLSASE